MKKITSIILIICFALLTVHCAAPEVNTTKEINNSPILNLCSVSDFTAYLENASIESNSVEEYDICVLLELNDPLSNESSWLSSTNISSDTNDIDEALREHRKKVKEYYVTQNEAAASSLDIKEYNYYVSYYSPYIEIVFDDLAEYKYCKNDIIESIIQSNNEVLSASSYATIDKINTSATVDDGIDFNTHYLLSEAFNDIGVSDSAYTGDGVKVGILEVDGVRHTDNLIPGKYTMIGSYTELDSTNITAKEVHGAVVASIIGGTTGIAEDAHLYCKKLSDSIISDLNLLIDSYEVNIINASWGYNAGLGYYVNFDSCIDNIISNTGCTIVVAAGNRSTDWRNDNGNIVTRDYKVISPGTAMNAITVGSINKAEKISCFSSWLVTDNFLLKPDVVAPGEMLWGITNIPNVKYNDNNNSYDYYGHNGTSFAAPMVTGTIALLMEEFPTLKTNPASVKSLLHLGAETLPSQTDYYDEKAGFGLINYENMRACRLNSNYANFIISYTATAGTTVLSRNITILYGDEIFINVNSTMNSINDTANLSRVTPNYTEYTINLIDTVTSVVVASSTVNSNVDFLTYENTNPNNTSFRIEIVLEEDNTSHEGELGSMAYEIIHIHSYDNYVWQSDTMHKCYCICGDYTTSAHVVAPSAFPNPEGYATCLLCGGDAFMGTLNSLSVNTLPHTANGSYNLQNRVIVLVEEDMEAYLNGTLVFYTGEIQ